MLYPADKIALLAPNSFVKIDCVYVSTQAREPESRNIRKPTRSVTITVPLNVDFHANQTWGHVYQNMTLLFQLISQTKTTLK